MELFFNFKQNIIVAKHNDKTYEMQQGQETELKCNVSLKPFPKATRSQYIALPDDEDKFAEALKMIGENPEPTRVGNRVRSIKIDGHTIYLTYATNEVGEPFAIMTGPFPRYFWRGLENILNKLIYK